MKDHLSCSFRSDLAGILSKKCSFHFLCEFIPHFSDYHCQEVKVNSNWTYRNLFVGLKIVHLFWFSLISMHLRLADIFQKQKFQIYFWEDFSWPTKRRRYRKLYEKCPCSCHHDFQAGKYEETFRKWSCVSEEILLSLMLENDTLSSFVCEFCS